MMRPVAVALALLLAIACAEPAPETEREAAAADEAASAASLRLDGPHDVAVIDLGDLGEIHVELLPEIAPRTVARFVEHARAGGYDDTTFHRVIPGFMIQGGSSWTRDRDPRNDGNPDPFPSVPDEFSAYPQVRGTVSLAHRGKPDSGSVQFFILLDEVDLNGRFAAFGRVLRGMDVVDAVAALEIDVYGRYGPRDRPYPVEARIETIRILPAAETATRPVADPSRG